MRRGLGQFTTTRVVSTQQDVYQGETPYWQAAGYDSQIAYEEGMAERDGANDSVLGILGDPIVKRGLAFIGAFALGAWLGGRLRRR
jgi:hypothetical protein